MLDQSREFNMLTCLLAVLASGSFARFNCDVFHFFFYTMSSMFFCFNSFYKLINSFDTLLVLFSR